MKRVLSATIWNSSRTFASPVILIGFLVLVSWILDIEFIKRPIPGLVAMNPATAICFVLSGLALWLLTSNSARNHSEQYKYGLMLAGLVLIIATVKIVGVLLEVDSHVDTLLFYEKLENDLVGNISNQMAPNTALAFFLASIALFILNYTTRGNHVPAQFIAMSIGMVGILSILGYLYQVKVFYGFLKHLPTGHQHGSQLSIAVPRDIVCQTT